MAEQRLNSLADRLEKVAVRLENVSSKPGSGGASAGADGELLVQWCVCDGDYCLLCFFLFCR